MSTENYDIYTDLALESKELADTEDSSLEGVSYEEREHKGVKVTLVRIENEEGERVIKKPIGNYITIESDMLKINDMRSHEYILDVFSKNLSSLLKLDDKSTVLIVGLGNWNVTPDSLGPKAIDKILVTRHILENTDYTTGKNLRSVAALSPGVLGITGVETAEIVRGVSERIKPDIVIAIDSLAARYVNRINTTIQICDTGITPGSGMGNNRKMINEKIIGIPVIGVGVPTVISAATLVNDTFSQSIESLKSTSKGEVFKDFIDNLNKGEKKALIDETLAPYVSGLFVTPKEVDETINRLAGIIATGINTAIQAKLTKEDIAEFMY